MTFQFVSFVTNKIDFHTFIVKNYMILKMFCRTYINLKLKHARTCL